MISGRIEGCTRLIGSFPDWDQGNGTIAGSLYIRDEITEGWPTFSTCWFPSPEEMDRVLGGKPIIVKLVAATMPGITVEVQK